MTKTEDNRAHFHVVIPRPLARRLRMLAADLGMTQTSMFTKGMTLYLDAKEAARKAELQAARAEAKAAKTTVAAAR